MCDVTVNMRVCQKTDKDSCGLESVSDVATNLFPYSPKLTLAAVLRTLNRHMDQEPD